MAPGSEVWGEIELGIRVAGHLEAEGRKRESRSIVSSP
jgi:hypothetical protein